MSSRLVLTIPGEPRGKGRARTNARVVETADGPIAVVSMHTPRETVEAEAAIRAAFQRKFPGHVRWTRAVMLKFVAVFPVPPSWPKKIREAVRVGTLYHTSKPDKDNIEKLLADALNGVAWIDDAQIHGGGIKRYGSPPRIEVTLEAIEQPDLPATPGQRAMEKRIAAGEEVGVRKPRRAKPKTPAPVQAAKAKPDTSRYPPALRAAIDAALHKGGGLP